MMRIYFRGQEVPQWLFSIGRETESSEVPAFTFGSLCIIWKSKGRHKVWAPLTGWRNRSAFRIDGAGSYSVAGADGGVIVSTYFWVLRGLMRE